MPITFSYRTVAVIAGAVIAVGAQVLAPQAGIGTAAGRLANDAAADLRGATSAAAQAAAVRYWTTARMTDALRAAKRPAAPERSLVRRLLVRAVPGQPTGRQPNRSGPWFTGNTSGNGLRSTRDDTVADAVGKVFFTLDGANYVCSGTLVGGRQADVVLTAAHCVTGGTEPDGAPDWATNWMFVPGFRDGQMPFGEYTARRFFVAPGWTGPAGSSEQYDVAFVQIAAGTQYGEPSPGPPPPSLPIGFTDSQAALPASRAYVFGYPALAPYTGRYPNYCAGPVAGSGGSVRMACGMTAGDSGGPWLAGFSPLSGTGTVVAVSTYKISDDLSVLYGAVLGPQARALYAQAVSPVR
jgi:V8-like Glu-specific endopeptidase